MFETEAEIAELQALIDRSFERAGRFLRTIVAPEKRLTARQVVRHLEGVRIIAVATVSSRSEPRVSPVDGHFLHGRFWFGTDGSTLRIRHLRRNAAISVVYHRGEEIAITVHGRAALFGQDAPEGESMRAYYTSVYGTDPYTWGSDEIVWVRVDPESMITYAPDPSQYPE